jgi:hypothetical protein
LKEMTMAERTSPNASPLEHVAARLRTAEVSAEPFPHYYLENVFPEEFYREMLRRLPGSAAYQNLFEVTDYKLDNFRHRDQRDLREGFAEPLPEDVAEFWGRFNEWFLGPDMAKAALASFAGPMRARFGVEESWPSVSAEAQLIRHRAGYFLGPHSDLYTKLVVLLIYLAPDDAASHLGTSLYRPKLPGFTCRDSKHHPFEEFVRVKTAPYRPNSLLAFFRSDVSFHGVEPLSERDVAAARGRDLIQYVLHDRAAREEQLRARSLAAQEVKA